MLVWLGMGAFGYHISYEYQIHLYRRKWSNNQNLIHLLRVLLGPINWVWCYLTRKGEMTYWADYQRSSAYDHRKEE